jgi:hypothetical protein
VAPFETGRGPIDESKEMGCWLMCQSCVEIDKKVDEHRELLRSVTDAAEIERINLLIRQLYADRIRLHQNPEE